MSQITSPPNAKAEQTCDTYHFFGPQRKFGVMKIDIDGSVCFWTGSSRYGASRCKPEEVIRYTPEEPTLGTDWDRLLIAVRDLLSLHSIYAEEPFVRPLLPPCHYHPRVWRGVHSVSNPLNCFNPVRARTVYGSAYEQSINAAQSLFKALEGVFRTVEPAASNRQTYGHRIRELLLLACMEVESSWKGIWNANHPSGGKYLTTKDYVQLQEPLRLSEWAVLLADYPQYGQIRPFEEWDSEKATQSIPWYEAYNSTKHDRENLFDCATLEAMLSAMAALHILLCAQWGPGTFSRWQEAAPSPFSLSEYPKYNADEIYSPDIHRPKDTKWKAVRLWE